MDIVPQNDRLVIDARVNPRDIDEVHAGLDARLRLVAYRSRRTPIIEGHVEQVSADKFVDKTNNESYYTAGMPVDVLIVTGERTFLSYLLTPFADSMYKAFREQ